MSAILKICGLRERLRGAFDFTQWGAEGATPVIKWGKLSGKRTAIPWILWRAPFKGPPKGKNLLKGKG
ncbi:MAG: hypothetical protein AMK69_17235 [Nitrospira bacterium SG8_3]|nr:MAG: hypothetical protein AMK69_17235 [Nitrospira bacterium SG8_3]